MQSLETEEITYVIDDDKLRELTELAENHWAKVDLKAKNENYNIVRIEDVKIHRKVFELTPPMTNQEFEELVNDIAINGQLEPIKIWRKRGSMFVVDGRNRINALKALGIRYVKYIEVKIVDLEDLETKILSWDKRRKTTKAQKAVVAYKDWKASGGSMDNIAAKYSVSKAYISYCRKIDNMKYGSIAVLDELFNKREVEINGKRLKSLTQIIRELERMNKNFTPDNQRPEGYEDIESALKGAYERGDLVALAYAKQAVVKMIKDLSED
jgi:CRISPR/Cas system-associated exonuclease Cas4 (RecB family)